MTRTAPDSETDSEGQSTTQFLLRKVGDKVVLENLSSAAEKAFKNIGLDDPGVFISWNDEQMQAALVILNNAAVPGQLTPPWLGSAPFPLTLPQLKSAIVTRVGAYGGGVVGNAIIAPNTLLQSFHVREQLCSLSMDPLLATLPAAVLPLASIYTMADEAAQATGTPAPPSAPPPPFLQIFA